MFIVEWIVIGKESPLLPATFFLRGRIKKITKKEFGAKLGFPGHVWFSLVLCGPLRSPLLVEYCLVLVSHGVVLV